MKHSAAFVWQLALLTTAWHAACLSLKTAPRSSSVTPSLGGHLDDVPKLLAQATDKLGEELKSLFANSHDDAREAALQSPVAGAAVHTDVRQALRRLQRGLLSSSTSITQWAKADEEQRSAGAAGYRKEYSTQREHALSARHSLDNFRNASRERQAPFLLASSKLEAEEKGLEASIQIHQHRLDIGRLAAKKEVAAEAAAKKKAEEKAAADIKTAAEERAEAEVAAKKKAAAKSAADMMAAAEKTAVAATAKNRAAAKAAADIAAAEKAAVAATAKNKAAAKAAADMAAAEKAAAEVAAKNKAAAKAAAYMAAAEKAATEAAAKNKAAAKAAADIAAAETAAVEAAAENKAAAKAAADMAAAEKAAAEAAAENKAAAKAAVKAEAKAAADMAAAEKAAAEATAKNKAAAKAAANMAAAETAAVEAAAKKKEKAEEKGAAIRKAATAEKAAVEAAAKQEKAEDRATAHKSEGKAASEKAASEKVAARIKMNHTEEHQNVQKQVQGSPPNASLQTPHASGPVSLKLKVVRRSSNSSHVAPQASKAVARVPIEVVQPDNLPGMKHQPAHQASLKVISSPPQPKATGPTIPTVAHKPTSDTPIAAEEELQSRHNIELDLKRFLAEPTPKAGHRPQRYRGSQEQVSPSAPAHKPAQLLNANSSDDGYVVLKLKPVAMSKNLKEYLAHGSD